jgi:signal transduction histidine kinase
LIFGSLLVGFGQTSYKDLPFYTSSISTQDAMKGFEAEIAKNINTSTSKARKLAHLYIQYGEDMADSTIVMHGYYQLGTVYFNTFEYDWARLYVEKAKALAEKQQDRKMLAQTLRTTGAIHFMKNQNSKALEEFNQSYEISKSLHDSTGMAKSLNNLSLVSEKSGEYENALNYLKRSLDLKIAYAPKPERISTLLNIGSVYSKLEDFEKSFEYYKLAENLAIEFKENHKLAQVWTHMALAYSQEDQYFEAEEYFKKSIQLSKKLGNMSQLATSYIEFSEFWMKISQWENAQKYLLLIANNNQDFTDPEILARAYTTLGKIEFELKNYEKARAWFIKSLGTNSKASNSIKADNYHYLAKISTTQGNFRDGYDYLLKSTQMKDSVFVERREQRIQELQMKYNSANDKKQIDQLLELAELKEKERKRTTTYFYITVIFLLITLGVAVALGVQMNINQKKSAELEKQIITNSEKTKELLAANIRAEEGLRVKSEFIAMVSHEIRTPLNAIIGMSSLLAETSLSKNQANYLHNIDISGNNLLLLVNDILDFSKVESGNVTIKIQPANLKKELEHIVDVFEPMVNEKGLKFHSEIDSEIPEFVFLDSPRLKQVLQNLLSNSVKFTHTGFVKLSVKILQREPTLNGEIVNVRFSVEDSGIGVPEEKKDEIFSSFQQLDSKVSRKYSGVGLGLSISQGILMMMNSKIELESEFAEGSTFWFDLKLKVDPEKKPKPENGGKNQVKFDKELGLTYPLRILVAEDNEINQKLIKINLNKMGYNPIIVTNGQEALDQLNKQSFDIILMDVQMPIMDGVSATKEIVRKYGDKKPVIVAVTANAMGSDKQSYIQAGMDDYISKPYSPAEIETCLRTWYVYIHG